MTTIPAMVDVLENRTLLAGPSVVSAVEITSITSAADVDGIASNEHVSVPQGTTAGVTINFTYATSVDAKPTAEIPNAAGFSASKTVSANQTTSFITLDVSSLSPGSHNVRVGVTAPNGDTKQNTDGNSIEVVITVLPTTTVNNNVPSGAVYDGNSHGISGATVSNANGVVAEAVVDTRYYDSGNNLLAGAPVNAGTYKVVSTYAGVAGTTDDSSDTDFFTIAKADATVAVTNYSGIYDAQTHTASVMITGVGGEALASNSVSRKNAGSDSTTASISGLQNYNDVSGTATIDIAKAHATVTVTNYTGTYDDQSHTASVTVTGVGGETATNSVSRTSAGSDSVTASLSDPENYDNAVTGTATITINTAVMTGVATTQAALNVAKNGTLAWTVVIDTNSIVDGKSVSELLNGAKFTLTINGVSYAIQSTATVGSDGIAYVN